MRSNSRFGGLSDPGAGGLGLSGPIPADLAALVAILLATFACRYFAALAAIPERMRLGPEVWTGAQIWRLATYPFAGTGGGGLWFVLELLILFLFGRDVRARLGAVRFWGFLLTAAPLAAVAATATAALSGLAGTPPFVLIQGQRILAVLLVAAFATLNRHATILLFFVLPVQASWFLGLEVLFAFLGFLPSRDLGGFLAVCLAVGGTFLTLQPGRRQRVARRVLLRLRERWLRLRLAWMRRRRGLRLIRPPGGGRGRGGRRDAGGDPGRGPWTH